MFILEHRHTAKGGPPRHVHREQDEWWYVLGRKLCSRSWLAAVSAGPGDSLFGLRGVPHAFAFVGDTVSRLLIVFQPAGKMEALFDAIAGQEGLATHPGCRSMGPNAWDQRYWRADDNAAS